MKFFKFILKVSMLCLLTGIFFTHGLANDKWIKVKSKNFYLIGNAEEKDIRQVGIQLEQFREVFRRLLTNFNFNSPVPTNVVVFKDKLTFSEYKPVNTEGKRTDWAAGYFQSGEDANYIVLTVEGKKADIFRTVFHEYIHFLVNNEIGRVNVPPWFNEGLAEYYELTEIDGKKKVILGNFDEKHLLLLQRNKLIPFETFINTDYYSLYRQSKDGAVLFYAQAWALMHYLMHGNSGARSPQLSKFIELISEGGKPDESFQKSFQTDYAALETELKKYIERKSFPVSVANFDGKFIFDGEMQTSQVTEAESKAVLGDLLYHLNRFTESAAHLEQALKLDGDSVLANTSLGLIKIRQDDFTEARKYFEKALALNDKNYLTHFRYAYALSREGMTFYGFVSGYDANQTRKMRASLMKAIELNPSFAESYNLYAFISMVRNDEIDQAIAYLDKALQIAPGNQWYAMRVAELYMRKEDFTNARRVAQKVFQTAPDDAMRVYAQNTIKTINSLEAQLEYIKNYKDKPESPKVTDEILSEEELARRRERATLESINEILRKPKGGEKRVLGYLTKIECEANEISYSVKVENKILNLRSENFDKLILLSYSGDLLDSKIGCDLAAKELFSVVSFKPFANPQSNSAGEIISIEFVPKNFKFIN
jgi:tetratricopeptide (TPR) repeat protein